jgi:hypothetical protein
LLIAAAALLAASVASQGASTAGGAQAENPLAGLRFYVDQDSPSMEQYRSLRRSGQTHKADLTWRIAREPKAVWVGRFTSPNFRVKVRRIFESAQQQRAIPILTVLRAARSTSGFPTGAV